VNVERRIARRLRPERVELRGKVTVPSIGRDDRHPGRDRTQKFVRIRFDFARSCCGLFGDRDRRRGLRRALRRFGARATRRYAEACEDRLVEPVVSRSS